MGSGNSTLSNVTDFNKPVNNPSDSTFETTPYNVNIQSGQKIAILMGNNYTGTNNELRGCIADVNRMKEMLQPWGFTCIVMTDLESGSLKVTRQNMLNILDATLSALDTDDTCLIYFSGHGSLINDTSGDEGSFGKDSVIIPIDYKTAGVISDDTIREQLLKATKGNAFCIFDSCNSGSMCDLRYNIFSSIYRTIVSLHPVLNPKNWVKTFSFATNTNYEETNTNVLSLSGSRDSQFSYEIQDTSGNFGGALTFALISVLREETPAVLISDLFAKVKAKLGSWGITSQTPQLMSGKTFDETFTFSNYMRI
jgi:metacaspase-1